MKIVHLTPLHFRERACFEGAEQYLLNLARGQVAAAQGACEVEIVSFARKPAERVLGPGITQRLLPAVNGRWSPLRVLSWELPEVVAGADLIHLHQVALRASEMTLLLARWQGKPVCATDHGSMNSTEGLYPDRLELADQVICCSDYGASLIKTQRPVAVIKGGVDGELFTPAPGVRNQVLFVGPLISTKGVDRLIAALPPELPLTVCARRHHRPYRNVLRRLARGKRVRFLAAGTDVEIREHYRRAWVLVLPSSYEDYYGNSCPAPELLGLTLLEAMACGTPVVCARAGAMPEFVRDGKTGFVYDTLPELRDQLRYLAQHPAVVEQMGQEARRAVEAEFDFKVVGARMLAVYRSLLGWRKEAAA